MTIDRTKNVPKDEIKVQAMLAASGFNCDDGGEYVCAPACIYLQRIEKGETKTSGGIIVPDGSEGTTAGEHRKGDNKRDKLRHGIVLGCGVYQQRDGTIVYDMPGWPLPNGTLLEHEVFDPMETATVAFGIIERIRCDVIGRWWLPGKWPGWAKRELAAMTKRGFKIS